MRTDINFRQLYENYTIYYNPRFTTLNCNYNCNSDPYLLKFIEVSVYYKRAKETIAEADKIYRRHHPSSILGLDPKANAEQSQQTILQFQNEFILHENKRRSCWCCRDIGVGVGNV